MHPRRLQLNWQTLRASSRDQLAALRHGVFPSISRYQTWIFTVQFLPLIALLDLALILTSHVVTWTPVPHLWRLILFHTADIIFLIFMLRFWKRETYVNPGGFLAVEAFQVGISACYCAVAVYASLPGLLIYLAFGLLLLPALVVWGFGVYFCLTWANPNHTYQPIAPHTSYADTPPDSPDSVSETEGLLERAYRLQTTRDIPATQQQQEEDEAEAQTARNPETSRATELAATPPVVAAERDHSPDISDIALDTIADGTAHGARHNRSHEPGQYHFSDSLIYWGRIQRAFVNTLMFIIVDGVLLSVTAVYVLEHFFDGHINLDWLPGPVYYAFGLFWMDFGFVTCFFMMISSRGGRERAQMFATLFLGVLSTLWLIIVLWLWIGAAKHRGFKDSLGLLKFEALSVFVTLATMQPLAHLLAILILHFWEHIRLR